MSRKLLTLFIGMLFAVGLALPGTAFADEPAMDTDVTAAEQEDRTVTTTADDTFMNEDVYYQAGRVAPATTVVSFALTGAAIGGVIGLGAWLLTGQDWNPWTIASFAGGGLVLGAGVGLVTVLAGAADDATMASTPSSVDWVKSDMPETFKVPVFQRNF